MSTPEPKVEIDTTAVVPHATPPGVASGRGFLFAPTTFAEAMKVAELLAASSFVPSQYKGKAGDVLCAIQYGAEVGLPPLQALQGVAVVNGRPSVWGDAALAIVLASGTVEDWDEHEEGEGEKRVAVCRGKRRGIPTVYENRYSVEDAKTARLWKKEGTWTTNPGRMLKMRARAFTLRDGWADYLKGLSVREEVEDYVVETPIQQPRRIEAADNGAPTEAKPAVPATDTSAPVGEPLTLTGDALLTDAELLDLKKLCSGHKKSFREFSDWLGREGVDSTVAVPARLKAKAEAWITGREPGQD